MKYGIISLIDQKKAALNLTEETTPDMILEAAAESASWAGRLDIEIDRKREMVAHAAALLVRWLDIDLEENR